MYFVRTEESMEQAQAALERGRSVRRWAYAGADPLTFLQFALPADERFEVVCKVAAEVGIEVETERDVEYLLFDREGSDLPEDSIIRVLGLEPFGDGWAQFLDGLCALASFVDEPSREEEFPKLNGVHLPLLVCYEGEFCGYDPDEGWELFRPGRIVWVRETGSDVRRQFLLGA